MDEKDNITEQIERLRQKHGRDDDDLWNEEQVSSEEQVRPEGAIGAFWMQAILVMLLSIIYVLLLTFNRPLCDKAVGVIKDKAAHDFSFRDKVYESVGGFITFLNEWQPDDMQSNGTKEGLIVTKEPDTGESVVGKPLIGESEEKKGVDEQADAKEAVTEQAKPAASGVGGEVNPVKENKIPANATLAPVVFTGRISFPIKKEYKVSSSFGFRNHPISGEAEFHTAADIAVAEGTPILAALDGRVIKSTKSRGLGNYILIDHGNDFLTIYGHCSRLVAKEGDWVREGEVVARVGSTGDSTGNHLHFGMKKDNLWFDPAYVFAEELNVTV